MIHSRIVFAHLRSQVLEFIHPLQRSIICAFFFVSLIAASSAVAMSQPADVPVQTRSVISSDGVRIVYDVRGSGDTTLFFVHCWACNRFFWRDQVDVFASSRYRVVTLDLAGHGESGKDRKHWSTLGLANDVRAVADDLNLQRIILVGHSMGGPVSLEAARLLRGRVIGVVLVDTMHDVDKRRPVASAQADAERLKSNFKGYFSDLSSTFSKRSDPTIQHWVEKQAQASDPAAAIALKLDTPNLDPKELFTQAGVPIRAINSKPPFSDYTNIEEDRRYANYDVILVTDAGHFVQLERPEEFNRYLARWIRDLSK
jgi:pimeloyl-ACP methyl ester carboxylesterase